MQMWGDSVRLIDADALEDRIRDEEPAVYFDNVRTRVDEWARFVEMVEDAPEVDAEPVVRCSDCKNGRPWAGTKQWFCKPMNMIFRANFYCAFAEMREEE